MGNDMVSFWLSVREWDLWYTLKLPKVWDSNSNTGTVTFGVVLDFLAFFFFFKSTVRLVKVNLIMFVPFFWELKLHLIWKHLRLKEAAEIFSSCIARIQVNELIAFHWK